MRRRLVSVALIVLVAGCAQGGDASDASPATEDGDAMTEAGSGVQVSGELDSKPTLTIPEWEAPGELQVTDVVDGDGDEARPGATVTAHYVGLSWSSGEQFDASWDRGEPIAFPLDQVITGWTEGIPGMREGGRRLLVIPPEQAYGDSPPAGSGIAPGETLVFVVDLVDTQ